MSNIAVVCLMLLIAGIYDCKQGKIPNWLTFGGYISGLVYLYCCDSQILIVRIVTSVIVFVVFYAFFAVGAFGAGDIKLFMMLSLYLDKRDFVMILGIAFAIATFIGVGKMLRGQRQWSKTTIHLAMPVFMGFCIWNIYMGCGGIYV